MSRLRISGGDAAWLSGQLVLFGLAFVVLPRVDGGPGRFNLPAAREAGTGVMAAGALVGLVSMAGLGRQLVPQPTPIDGGTLVDSGAYGIVRHPIYTAVLLLIIGGLLRTPSLTGIAVVVASAAFFDRKSAHEERLLAATYPEYDRYRQQVRFKLVPGIR